MYTLRTGEPQHNIVMGVHKPDGPLTWILINSQPIWNGDPTLPAAVVASFVDITERKRNQALLQTRLELVEYSNDHSLNDLMQTALDTARPTTETKASNKTPNSRKWETQRLRELKLNLMSHSLKRR